MKYIHLAFGMMKKRWLFTVIIIIETAVLLVLTNTMIATANSKYMLYEDKNSLFSVENSVFLSLWKSCHFVKC